MEKRGTANKRELTRMGRESSEDWKVIKVDPTVAETCRDVKVSE